MRERDYRSRLMKFDRLNGQKTSGRGSRRSGRFRSPGSIIVVPEMKAIFYDSLDYATKNLPIFVPATS